MATSPGFVATSPRPDLRDSLVEFDVEANRMGMVGPMIAPSYEVQEQFGDYRVTKAEELLKEAPTLRNSDGSYNRIGGVTQKASYRTEEHGLEERVDNREAAIYRSWYSAEQLAAQRCRNTILMAHNQRVIDAALAGAANTAAAGTIWTNLASTPIADVRTGAIAIRDEIGSVQDMWMVIDWDRFQYLKDNTEMIDRLKSAGFQDPDRGNITEQAIAEALGIDRLIVSKTMRNTANDPSAASFSTAWDKTKALLFVRPATSDLQRPQYMRTFHWSVDGSSIGGAMESYGDNIRRSEIVRCRMDVSEDVVYSGAAYVITGC